MKRKTIELVNFLHQLVIKKKLLKSNQSIILAISGGQDSISLLFIFLQLKDQWNWKLSIIYCNHLWQKDSFYTMLHLFKLSYLLNLPLYLPVTLQKVLTEQKARNWRSLTFQRITGFSLLSVIVTGHSKSDRIETGFFNLFRGSGTQGVGSLNWTKVKIKDYFFKLNKKNLKQISINYPMLLKSSSWSQEKKGHDTTSKKKKVAHTASSASNPYGVCLSAALSETKIKFFVIGLTSSVEKKQTKITCIPSHQEEMSTQIKIRILPMPDAPTNKNRGLFKFFDKEGPQHYKQLPFQIEESTKNKPTLLKSKILKARNVVFVSRGIRHHPSYKANYIARGLLDTRFLSQFYKNEYVLVRPFLSLTRFDLKKICNSWKIPLFPDQSNQKLKYQRNRIRKQILPTLRFFFNPQIDTTIYQFIEIINSEQEYMDFITARIVNEIQFYQKQTIVELETSFINVLPLPIRRKVIKQFLMRFVHKKNYKFFDVEQFLQQISMSCFLKEQKINEKKIKLFETKCLQKEKQKDFLVNIINQKQGKCKLYKLFFFPKTGSIFLQSQRVFFIKKLR